MTQRPVTWMVDCTLVGTAMPPRDPNDDDDDDDEEDEEDEEDEDQHDQPPVIREPEDDE